VEGHALLQPEHVNAVALDLPLARELGLELDALAVGRGDLQQAVVDVVVDRAGGDEGRLVGIERVDVLGSCRA
jgi:hypothetical protein